MTRDQLETEITYILSHPVVTDQGVKIQHILTMVDEYARHIQDAQSTVQR